MLQVLAQLSIIKARDFGIACFTTLTDIMESGQEMEDLVIKFLREDVISKLRQDIPHQIPAPLLIGLYELVKRTEQKWLLYPLFDSSFPKWLDLYMEKIKGLNGKKPPNDDHFDAIIMLMSTAVGDG